MLSLLLAFFRLSVSLCLCFLFIFPSLDHPHLYVSVSPASAVGNRRRSRWLYENKWEIVHRYKNVWLQPHTVGYLIREHGPLFEPWSVRHTGLMQLYLDTALSEGKLIYILQRQKSTRKDVNMLMLNSFSLRTRMLENFRNLKRCIVSVEASLDFSFYLNYVLFCTRVCSWFLANVCATALSYCGRHVFITDSSDTEQNMLKFTCY